MTFIELLAGVTYSLVLFVYLIQSFIDLELDSDKIKDIKN